MPNLNLFQKNYKKFLLFSEMTKEETHTHSLWKSHKHIEQRNPSLRVIGIERLLKPVAGAWGHLVHTCNQESKRHFQRRASTMLSDSNIWNPKAPPQLKTHNIRWHLTHDPNQLMAYWKAQDAPFYNLTMHSSLIHTDPANRYVHKKEQGGHYYNN